MNFEYSWILCINMELVILRPTIQTGICHLGVGHPMTIIPEIETILLEYNVLSIN